MALKSIFDRSKKRKVPVGVIRLDAHEAALMHFHDANIAILYQNLRHWCSQNEVNDRNFHDGRYWYYNSAEAFAVQFPMWTPKQIRLMLAKLEKEGWIATGVYNTLPADRTKWYADLHKKG